MNRRDFMKPSVISSAGLLAGALSIHAREPSGKRPNILFAIADDWGWPHAGAYGDPGGIWGQSAIRR